MASGLQFQHAHGVLSERCAHSQRRLKRSRAAQIARIVPGEAGDFVQFVLDGVFMNKQSFRGLMDRASFVEVNSQKVADFIPHRFPAAAEQFVQKVPPHLGRKFAGQDLQIGAIVEMYALF